MRNHFKSGITLASIEVVYEDPSIIVLNKPSGLLVLPDRFNPAIPNLLGLLRDQFGTILVVHRIDKETSGLIVFAKTEEAHKLLNEQFEHRSTEKIYTAICMGEPSQQEGTIDLPLSENPGGKGGMRVDVSQGKAAVTGYRILERFEGYSCVEAQPKTGRTHQIRVHLSAINLPLLGDSTYGGGEGFFLSQIKPGYRLKGTERPLLSRAALHAAQITVEHPVSRERVTFVADLPKDMKVVLNYLRKFRAKAKEKHP